MAGEFDPLYFSSGASLSDANRRVSSPFVFTAQRAYALSLLEVEISDPVYHYFELVGFGAVGVPQAGVATTAANLDTNLPGNYTSAWVYEAYYGRTKNSGLITNTDYANGAYNSNLGVLFGYGRIYFYLDGVLQGGGDPNAGTLPAYSGLSGIVRPIGGARFQIASTGEFGGDIKPDLASLTYAAPGVTGALTLEGEPIGGPATTRLHPSALISILNVRYPAVFLPVNYRLMQSSVLDAPYNLKVKRGLAAAFLSTFSAKVTLPLPHRLGDLFQARSLLDLRHTVRASCALPFEPSERRKPGAEIIILPTNRAYGESRLVLHPTDTLYPATELSLPPTITLHPATELSLPPTITLHPATELSLPPTATLFPKAAIELETTDALHKSVEINLVVTDALAPSAVISLHHEQLLYPSATLSLGYDAYDRLLPRVSLPLNYDMDTETVEDEATLHVNGKELDFISADIDGSEGSGTIRVSVELADEAPYNSVAIGDSGEIRLNGDPYVFVVTDKAKNTPESGTFIQAAERGFSFTGVSPSIEYTEGYAQTFSQVWDEPTQARSIVTDLLGSIDWGILDWGLRGGVLSAEQAAPWSVAATVVAAPGGELDTLPDGTIVARYKYSPPVPKLPRAVPDVVFTEDHDIYSSSETFGFQDCINAVRVLDKEPAISDQIEFEDNGDLTGVVRVFPVPWRDLSVEDTHSGLQLHRKRQSTYETSEIQEAKAGSISLSRPIHRLLSIEYLTDDLGSVEFVSEGRELSCRTTGYSLVRIHYESRVILYDAYAIDELEAQLLLVEP